MHFPYTTIPKAPPRPYLEVVLHNGYHTSEIVLSLVDSGADYPIFPMEVAEHYLKLDLTKAGVWTFAGTTGETQVAKLARVSITLLKPNGMDHLYEIPGTICAFCDTFTFAGGGLLGRDGFFSLFKTTFHEPQKYFVLEPWPAT